MNSPEERYFAELSLRLKRLGFELEPIEDGLLPVKWEGERLCRFEPNGTMHYHSPVPPERESALEAKSMPPLTSPSNLMSKSIMISRKMQNTKNTVFIS